MSLNQRPGTTPGSSPIADARLPLREAFDTLYHVPRSALEWKERRIRRLRDASETTETDRGLNFYEGEYLAKIKRVLRHAELTRRDELDSWRNDYEDHVRWLVEQLERRLPGV